MKRMIKDSSSLLLKASLFMVLLSVNCEDANTAPRMLKFDSVQIKKPSITVQETRGYYISESVMVFDIHLNMRSDESITSILRIRLPNEDKLIPDQNSFVKSSKNGVDLKLTVNMFGYHLLEPNSNIYLEIITRKHTFLHYLFTANKNELPKKYFIGTKYNISNYLTSVYVFTRNQRDEIFDKINSNVTTIHMELPFNRDLSLTLKVSNNQSFLNSSQEDAKKQDVSIQLSQYEPPKIHSLQEFNMLHSDGPFLVEGYKEMTKEEINNEINNKRSSLVVNIFEKNGLLKNIIILPKHFSPLCEVRDKSQQPSGTVGAYCHGPTNELAFKVKAYIKKFFDDSWVTVEDFTEFKVGQNYIFLKTNASSDDFGKYKIVLEVTDYNGQFESHYQSEELEIREIGTQDFAFDTSQILYFLFISLLAPPLAYIFALFFFKQPKDRE